ncbi:hypothetical protein [Fervidibacillus albus]|uniref:Uncharacterized protein n=1 Tax=Fervidibacillus albus TaxID=2980026 RepID=A0A9E8LUW5_9BACI|nr:hypothetical protein [Fervidibacillus albus]WAA10135.1 hypothetical protein OE104_01970 [Fervidibacillus albus]
MSKREFFVHYAVVVLAIFLVVAAFSYRQQAEEREGSRHPYFRKSNGSSKNGLIPFQCGQTLVNYLRDRSYGSKTIHLDRLPSIAGYFRTVGGR